MAGECLLEESVEAHRLDRLFRAGRPEPVDILRSRALVLILDQTLLEDQRVRGIDDGQLRKPRIVAQRGRPGDCPAPVVTDERKALQAQRVCEREDVPDQSLRLVLIRVQRAVGPGKAALVGHDQAEAVFEPWCDLPPGAVRFRKPVQEHDRRSVFRPGEGDVERDPGRQADAAEIGHG